MYTIFYTSFENEGYFSKLYLLPRNIAYLYDWISCPEATSTIFSKFQIYLTLRLHTLG